jgi:hypothetical protein
MVDVHSQTAFFRKVVDDRLIEILRDAHRFTLMNPCINLYRTIEGKYQDRADPDVVKALKNMLENWTQIDPDLGSRDLRICSIIAATWSKVEECEAHDHFRETLAQISSTCLQGISHRLLSDWIILSDIHPTTGICKIPTS